MPVAATCPHCRNPLPAAAFACPRCGRALRELPTRTFHDLNTTGDHRIEAVDDGTDRLTGTRLANYQVECFLGEGGMARVYRARHLMLQRPCALKILKSSYCASDENAAACFLAEARAAAALVHPNVVTIHTIGQDDERHYIEMEYVEGTSLNAVLGANGAFDFSEATRVMVQIASALSLAHQCGMVHRDIKPANVLFSRDRIAKLADFGLAKQVRTADADDGRVLTGTPNYMAPELFSGFPADTRSDVYAMGVTYYQLLTGRLPLRVNAVVDLIRAHRQGTKLDAQALCRDLPDSAATIIQRCLAPDPEDRYSHASVLLAELRAAYGCLRSLDSLLRESLQGLDVSIRGAENLFEVLVYLPNGRRQKVQVEIAASAAIAEQVVRISSTCGVADPRYYLRALRLNPSIAYGALGVELAEGVPQFVMTNVYPRATCDPEEVRRSVLTIARHADEAERWLAKEDLH